MSHPRSASSGAQTSLPIGASDIRTVTLTRLAGEIARQLHAIGAVVVEGEVHRATPRTSGRQFFTLRDRVAQISVHVPANRARFARIVNGERVAVTGQLVWGADRGLVHLEASEVVPVGAGAVAAAIADARARLTADGLLARTRRPLPLLPAVIGVLCGTDAAVRRDIESVVAVRFPGYPVVFEEVLVSGPGAVESLLRGLDTLDADPTIEVVIVARGGGDSSQLLPFSDEQLCRRIVAMQRPVVSAIGHEGDRPLCDEVADWRAGTPSIAAQRVVPDRLELDARLRQLLGSASAVLEQQLARSRHRVERVQWTHAIDRRLEAAVHRLDRVNWHDALEVRMAHAAGRIQRVRWQESVTQRAAAAREHLGGLVREVEALSPQRVLERGYAVVRTIDGTVVRDGSALARGTLVDVELSGGSFEAEVTATRERR